MVKNHIMKTEFVQLSNGLSIAFWKVSNPGKPWLALVHGLQNNKASFQEVLDSDLAKDFSIIATDLIGFGESSKPEEFDYDLKKQASVITYVLNHEGIDTFHCIGHSMGGMIGTIMLDTMPDRISSFVSMEGNLLLEDCGESVKSAAKPWPEFQDDYYPALKKRIAESTDASAPVRAEAMKQIPDYAFYRSAKSIGEWCASKKLLGYFVDAQCPAVLMVGTKGAFKTRPANTVDIEGSGHFLLQDQPQRTLAALRAFYR